MDFVEDEITGSKTIEWTTAAFVFRVGKKQLEKMHYAANGQRISPDGEIYDLKPEKVDEVVRAVLMQIQNKLKTIDVVTSKEWEDCVKEIFMKIKAYKC